MKEMMLKDIKKGEYFTLKPIECPKDSQVYVKDEYDRSAKQYIALKYTDYLGSGRYFKGTKTVYVDFTF